MHIYRKREKDSGSTSWTQSGMDSTATILNLNMLIAIKFFFRNEQLRGNQISIVTTFYANLQHINPKSVPLKM